MSASLVGHLGRRAERAGVAQRLGARLDVGHPVRGPQALELVGDAGEVLAATSRRVLVDGARASAALAHARSSAVFTSACVCDRARGCGATASSIGTPLLLRAVAEAERHGAARAVLLAGDELERHLVGGVRADLLLHAVVAVVDARRGRRPRLSCATTLVEVVGVLLGDRDADDLHGREPHRERAGVVLEQDREEPLDRTEQRAVDHDRALLLAVAVGVLELEALGQVGVDLDGRQLPGAADRVLAS